LTEFVLIHNERWSVVAEYAVNLEKYVDARGGKVSFGVAIKLLHALMKHRERVQHEVEVR